MLAHMSITVILAQPNHLHNAHPTHISTHHNKTVFLPNFFHLAKHTNNSTSAHPLQKSTQQSSLYHLPTLPTSTIFLHSSSFTITPTLPTESPFSDHHSLYLPPTILDTLPHHLMTYKQHTSTILLLNSSHTVSFTLNQPILHIQPTPQGINQSPHHIARCAYALQVEVLHLLC